VEVVRIHDDILRMLRSGWNDPREIPGEWFSGPASGDSRRALAAWIEKEMRGKDSLLIKDPRMCRLLPLWQIVCGTMGIDTCTVIPFRHPIEVARSLKARDKLPEMTSLFLWLRHVLDAERFSRGRARSFVSFDQLMNDGPGTVRRIGSELGLTFVTSDPELAASLGAALKPGLRHHTVADDEVSEACRQVPAMLETYRWLLAAAEAKTPPFEPLDEMTYRMRMSEQSRGITIAVPDASNPPKD
jgi:hypothetical protein